MNPKTEAWHLARRFPGGVETVAKLLGLKYDNLRKQLPGHGDYKFSLDDADALTQLAIAHGIRDPYAIVTAMALNAGGLFMPLPEAVAPDGPLFACLAETTREFSEFMTSVAEAEADGRVTANELRRVEHELAELIARAQQCVSQVRAHHEAAKPAHERGGAGS